MAEMKLKEKLREYSKFGFHISYKSWQLLKVSELSKSPAEALEASDIYLMRQLADRINKLSEQRGQPPISIYAGQLISVSVLVDVFRYIIGIYGNEEQPRIISRAAEWTGARSGQDIIDKPLHSFVHLFPPNSILNGEQLADEYIRNSSDNPDVFETTIKEIILLFFSMTNRAFRPFLLLFDDSDLKKQSPYADMIKGLENYFKDQPLFRHTGLTLFESIRAPMMHDPNSLEGQLQYIRQHWQHFLPADLLERIMLTLDILEEERLMRGLGPGAIEALRFDRDSYGLDLGYAEPEAFSRDADWMSNVVLIAKSVYIWLYQLSRKYQREIRLLSDIPDEELDQLARWGFTGLWLIGLWERSSASRKIKEIMGNPEAAASAYSLYDYVIASDLGGEEAYQNLKDRAWQRGIRLASDMVPNHVGIYSNWVIEHPQWFIQSDHPPFPAYQFTGVDLSEDPRVCIQIEDGYWQHRDAAVVFKRIDKWTGDTRYIYHGNDGTSMPWNDTAQLNFLSPEVREAVIQTILHVARKFSIIRFDAAMTLAKKHYQRLWFPQPGEGGAIPSRAEHSLTRKEFEALMPKEFWREVVDRIASEVPDTLLIAEAFWLMEGYFVRTLGMHRVYNSAFMNMLKMEDNAKFRTTIKNVLEFSPKVLKRLVNFMNNPDEATAVEQFGRGDKYYGVAMMMVTMPGLPMFGHGQIEGFTEKYGMEYRRSYWDEQVDQGMVDHHERQIFPLMKKRYLFSGAANFAFFDFFTNEGWVDENVMAYSNRVGDERALVLYNNAYNTTKGTARISTRINTGESDKPSFIQKTLAEALALNTDHNCFYVFREYRSGLEYIRSAGDMADRGLFAELHAYEYQVFLDFREIHDSDGSWRELERSLNGGGVSSIDEAHQEMRLKPILGPYRALMSTEILKKLYSGESVSAATLLSPVRDYYDSLKEFSNSLEDTKPYVECFLNRYKALLESIAGESQASKANKSQKASKNALAAHCAHVAFAWMTSDGLGEFRSENEITPSSVLKLKRFEDWLMGKAVREAFEGVLNDSGLAYWDSRLVGILLAHSDSMLIITENSLGDAFGELLTDQSIRDYLQINRYEDTLWLNKEKLVRMIDATSLIAKILSLEKEQLPKVDLGAFQNNLLKILSAAEKSGYQVEKMLALLK
jgi:glycosidase